MTDELPPELEELKQRLFAAGRAERPEPALGRRLLMIEPRSIGSGEAPPAAELASSGARRRVVAGSRWGQWVALAALLAGATGLWLELRTPTRALSISAEKIGAVAASSKPEQRELAERASIDPAPPPPAVATTSDSASEVVVQAPRPRPARALERKALPPSAPPPVPEAAITPERSDEVEPAPTVAPVATAEPPRAPALTLLEEIELLKRARSAQRAGDGPGALVLLDRHQRERAGDSLIAEATLLRIEVLAALGRRATASELAQRFVRDNPNHALSDRARSFITGATPPVP